MNHLAKSGIMFSGDVQCVSSAIMAALDLIGAFPPSFYNILAIQKYMSLICRALLNFFLS